MGFVVVVVVVVVVVAVVVVLVHRVEKCISIDDNRCDCLFQQKWVCILPLQ